MPGHRPIRRRSTTAGRRTAIPPDKPALLSAKRAVRHLASVVGVDFGYVYQDEIWTGQTGIRYHVSRKKPLNSVPPEERLPRRINGLRVDVIEAGYKPHADPFSQAAVLQPGLSIGNIPRNSDGTLGYFVRDIRDGALCILSNWHVLCGDSSARVGDEISQPGPIVLGGAQPHQIAMLRRWVVPPSGIDAAIASIVAACPTKEILLGGQTKVGGAAVPVLGMTVVKSGMGSGLTHALVDGVNGNYLVPYTQFPQQNCWMDGMRLVKHPQFNDAHVSAPGDSGSVWADLASGSAIGLHFAGEDDKGPLNEYALAHPISEVFKVLGVQTDPG